MAQSTIIGIGVESNHAVLDNIFIRNVPLPYGAKM